MKFKITIVAILLLALFTFFYTNMDMIEASGDSLAGRYVGYSWRGETDGVEFEDADRYIETILELDNDGTILDVKIRYWQQYDGYWGTRNSDNADIWVDFDEEPTMAGFNDSGEYELGNSMFKISTNAMTALYGAKVDEETGQTAAFIVDPWHRFVHEMKFDQNYDFENTTVGERLTFGGGNFFATVRAARQEEVDWEKEYGDNTIFDMIAWNHVITTRGTFEGMNNNTSVKNFLEAMGVEFENGTPVPMDEPAYGYYGQGGWTGNYAAIAEHVTGRNATEYTNLYDPDAVLTGQTQSLSASINENNEFGIDVPTGATRNVQDSFDTVSGATVRVSREATSYQRALVAAGILDEEDVIIGRF